MTDQEYADSGEHYGDVQVTISESRQRSLREAGYSVLRGERDWIERVIQCAIETDTGIYHAAWLVSDRTRECSCTPCMRAAGRLGY